MASLQRAAYRSRAFAMDPALLSLAEIIAVSDRNNRRDGLTGALLVSSGRFFQILEGAPIDLDRTLARIAVDPRHRDIEIVLREPAERRLFEGWSMVAAKITPSVAPKIDDAIEKAADQPHAAIALVAELVSRQHRPG